MLRLLNGMVFSSPSPACKKCHVATGTKPDFDCCWVKIYTMFRLPTTFSGLRLNPER